MKKTFITSLLLCGSLFTATPVMATLQGPIAAEGQVVEIIRLAGASRYETAKTIAEEYARGKIQNVILATGNGFADALSASVLAHEKKAPLLLVDSKVETSLAAFAYIKEHLDVAGTVYIMGGAEVIGEEFVLELKRLGYKTVVRVSGSDRYGTSCQAAGLLNNKAPDTVVIASGDHYPDALSIASVAAHRGWPLLLTPSQELPFDLKRFLLERKPVNILIVGGEGAVSPQIEEGVKGLLPQAKVNRLTGASRFDTNAVIAGTFAANPETVYLATGFHYADALAGSVLAARTGSPILFIDPAQSTLPKKTAEYLERTPTAPTKAKLVVFGGSGAVSEDLRRSAVDLITDIAQAASLHSIPDLAVTVTQKEVYRLPRLVPARLYNGDTSQVAVKWNLSEVDTHRIGTEEYEGKAEGLSKQVKLKLTVKEPPPIAEYTTLFDKAQVNRTENIRLAAKALDGKLLAPGERFSFNKIVGERTAKAGYKEALIIEGDAFIPGLGGGICQVSSSLYNAALEANLEIVERHRHTLPVNYVPPGQDATVAYPALDFKFKNSKSFPLYIRSIVAENMLTFQLFKKV